MSTPLIVVLDMQDRRPAWGMPEWVPDRLRAALPTGSELRVIAEPNDGSGDGAARVAPEVLAAVADADAYLGYGIPPSVLAHGPRLRWVHSGAAGVGGSLTPELLASSVAFTNSAGVHADPIAETVLAMILHFLRGLDVASRARERGNERWDTGPFYVADSPARELSRSTVGVIGFGGVGRAVGTRCAALGARVLGLRRTSEQVPNEMSADASSSRPSDGGIEVASGTAARDRLLEESDVVVLCVPETPETRGLIGRQALARMKRTAVLINVGRGALVDSTALLEALRDGRLRGAGLDVFEPEPVPDDHPIWELPNVIMTPHVSAVTAGFWDREAALIERNIRRLARGEPLENLVDPERGY